MKECPYCSSEIMKVYHTGLCPKIKSVEYYDSGEVKKVEFNEDTPNYFPVRPARVGTYTVEWLTS